MVKVLFFVFASKGLTTICLLIIYLKKDRFSGDRNRFIKNQVEGDFRMRLFIAINFDSAVKDSLIDLQEDLRQAGVSGRWTVPENLHMTAAFIGEYGDPDEVLEVMEGIPFAPFTMTLRGVQRVRDMYFVRTGECRELKDYVRRLRKALSDRGIPFDRKKFSPHITLARRVSIRGEGLYNDIEVPDLEMEVDGISLMRSDRGKHGMIYTELGRVTI